MTASEEDLLLEDLLIENLELVLIDLAIEEPSKEYDFDDCEEKAYLFIDYFANVILKGHPLQE